MNDPAIPADPLSLPSGTRLPRRGNRLTVWLGRRCLRLWGWEVQGRFADEPRLIVAVAPHTSNFDWVLSVLVILALRLRASYLVKSSLFRGPMGLFMTAAGGLPVDRNSPQGLVEQIADRFRQEDQLVLGITPEGTRARVHRWKQGFAQIAEAANVPVLPVTLNYETRTIRFEPVIRDVSDTDVTLARVQDAARAAWPAGFREG